MVICVLSVLHQLKKKTRGRNALLISLLCMNFILAGLIGYKMFMSKDVAVSDFLMFIFGANYIVYAIYYGLSKYYYVLKMGRATESLTFTCWIYILLSTSFGICGMYFFVSKQKKTGLSSSESRHLNSECMFWFFVTFGKIEKMAQNSNKNTVRKQVARNDPRNSSKLAESHNISTLEAPHISKMAKETAFLRA